MFLGFVDDSGYFAFDRSPQWKLFCEKHKGHEVLLIAKRKPARQGSQAMRYYRGVVVPDIARACGYTDTEDWQDIHNALAWKFLRLSDHPQIGTPRRRSTKKNDMTGPEMTDYIHQCVTWAETSIPGCRVRRPEEQDLDDVYAPDYDEDM